MAVGVASDFISTYRHTAVYRGLNVLRSRAAPELDWSLPASKESIRERRVSRSEAFTVHMALARRTKKGMNVDDNKVLCAILVVS